MAAQACLSAGLLALCLPTLTSGRSTHSLSPPSSTEKSPWTLDEVLMKAAGSHNNLQNARKGRDHIVDGLDMVLSRQQFAKLYEGPVGKSQGADEELVILWPNGRIPYEIDYDYFTYERIVKIQEGMQMWQNLTCITFNPASSDDVNRVQIVSSIGCFSELGMNKEKQPQILSLNYHGCFYQGTVEHELGHAIGLVHEHQRPERDDHLGVYVSNAIPSFRDQLQVYRKDTVDKLGLDYDYYSVMHYGKAAFSFDGVSPTMYAYDRRRQEYLPQVTEDLGKVLGPSFIDVKLVNLMYNCSDDCPAMPECRGECFVDKHCRCFCPEHMPPVPCENYLADCELWAQKGECWTNQPYMEYFCRKACRMCPSNGTIPPEKPQIEPPCEDKRSDCQSLADLGDCQDDSLRHSMLLDCRRTCTGCAGTATSTAAPATTPSSGTTEPQTQPPCKDMRADCRVLAERGDCDSNPSAMMRECRQSCTGCAGTASTTRPSGTSWCEDDDVNCPAWQKASYCDYYPHIIPTCKKSCGACT